MITLDDATKAIEEMKAQGASENDLLGAIYYMFQKGDIDLEEYKVFADALGYELSEQFLGLSEEEQKKFVDLGEEVKGATEEGREDETDREDGNVSEMGEEENDESKDEGEKPGVEDKKEDANPKEEEKPSQGNPEDEELKQARKLYGFDK